MLLLCRKQVQDQQINIRQTTQLRFAGTSPQFVIVNFVDKPMLLV